MYASSPARDRRGVVVVDGGLIMDVGEFLIEPWSGAVDHRIPAAWAWHGRLMVLAGAVLFPIGVILARYYKVTPRQDWPAVLDNRFWWVGHRLTQYLGVGLMTAAVGVVWASCAGGDPAGWPCRPARMSPHSLLGLTVLAIGWAQVVLGLVRGSKGGPTDGDADPDDPATWRGDHYDMTPRRLVFEWSHKLLGYVALLLAVAAIVTGLVHADAPRWMFLALALWWTGLSAWAVRMQRDGRNIDTYQAIWGSDPHHPGARRRPTGFGVRRYRPPDADRLSDIGAPKR